MNCPVCAERVIGAHGDTDSEILLVGSAPSEDEIYFNRPFTGPTINIFRKELHKNAKIDLSQTRQILAHYHDKLKKADCVAVSMSLVMKEIEGKKVVVLVGADAVREFTGLSVQDTNGLCVTDEVRKFMEDEKLHGVKFFSISSPQTVFRSLGEFRFGLIQLGKWMVDNG